MPHQKTKSGFGIIGRISWLILVLMMSTSCNNGSPSDGGTGGDDPPSEFSVGGTLSGLDGTVVLRNNGDEALTLSTNGNFQFETPLLDGESYDVTVESDPAQQTCIVANGSGSIPGADVGNVVVTCSDDATPPDGLATLSVLDSPLPLFTDGPSGGLTITNTSLTVTATNIASNFSNTALDGNVVESGNTCASLVPGASCTLTYTPGATVVAPTDFPISGTNTSTVTATMAINPPPPALTSLNPSSGSASGGTGFTITGINLTGTTSVTFGGVEATSVNVIDSTTVTGVTPAHAIGAVDVDITTPNGSGTLPGGYTYLATAVGQSSSGGTIACLDGGLQNLLAATADNSSGIEWGGLAQLTNASSNTDGATNSTTIKATLGNNGGMPYAAQLCENYEVDSQGNIPCQAGNTCYNDWFLPAKDQLNCLETNQVAIGGFSASFYWSSTEFNATNAWLQSFLNGSQVAALKNSALPRVRCVRGFTP